MKPFNTYRHASCLDIDMYVHKIPYIGLHYFKAKVTLFNRHNKIVYDTLNVKITKESLKLWRLV